MQTANGVAPAWRIRIDRVRVGEVEVHQVDAVVSPLDMPVVLLGNSFLSRFRMQRDGDQMVLDRRY
jgi:aspartyl protease family protein